MVYILTGMSGSGKTTFAVNLLNQVDGNKLFIFADAYKPRELRQYRENERCIFPKRDTDLVQLLRDLHYEDYEDVVIDTAGVRKHHEDVKRWQNHILEAIPNTRFVIVLNNTNIYNVSYVKMTQDYITEQTSACYISHKEHGIDKRTLEIAESNNLQIIENLF